MALLTLVENAVRHGIDPSEQGGRIEVGARARRGDGRRARLSVADTGVGMRDTARPAPAWRTCASGCAAFFGADARLELRENAPHGVRAEIDASRCRRLIDRARRCMTATDRTDRRRRAAAARAAAPRTWRGSWPELQIVAEARNGREAVELFEQHAPRSCFLDVHMPGMNGVEAARCDRRARAQIVFVTAYEQYAVQAFEQGAIDYLVKPFDEARLADTVQRLKERLARAPRRRGGAASSTPCSSSWRAELSARHAGTPAAAAVDPGLGRQQRAADPGRAGGLPALRREVHAGGVGRRRGADPQDDPRAGR